MTEARIAVIVPTLNEEEALKRSLPALLALCDARVSVTVSDGGSQDRTKEVAQTLGVPVISGSSGRGIQLDRGAAASSSEILLFLHADSALPSGAFESIRRVIGAGAVGGGFLVRFEGGGRLMRLAESLVNLRTRATRLPLGDQAQFVSRSVFDQLGGYREWPVLEDLDLGRRLKRAGRVVILEMRATTSARRFVERGVLRTVATNWLIWALYFFGVSPHRLAPLYRQVR